MAAGEQPPSDDERARHARLSELVAECLDLDDRARAAFLAKACGDDDRLRAQVESILTGEQDDREAGLRPLSSIIAGEAADLLSGLPATAGGGRKRDDAAGQAAARVADQVPGYELVEELGVGGFGTVWLARQLHPVQREVAVKILKPGMDTRDILARFRREQQALARMSHDNVARVLDAGATAAGRPFFAMELIRGLPITEHCDAERLTTRERLRLFIRACRGVQHAHQQGLIHRDIKPSNVLVVGEGEGATPKVIDFGIAKAIEGEPGEQSVHTRHGDVIGTPDYMSPEQATAGASVDTRTDIYSLGVLLYELLTGTLPFDRAGRRRGGPASLARDLPSAEPVRPSDRLRLRTTIGLRRLRTTGGRPPEGGADGSQARRVAEVARLRATDPAALRRTVRGDLDAILLTALDREPERRYPTVDALVADIERHLADIPVAARPPSALYRFRKLAARHRLGVAGGALSLALLVAGLLGTSYGLVAANRARQLAEARRAGAEEQAYRGSLLLAETAIAQHRLDAAHALLDDAPERLRGWEWHHLRSRLDIDVTQPLPADRPGLLMRLAPGGELTWTAARREVHAWDADDARLRASWDLDEPPAWLFAVSERELVGVTFSGRALLLDAASPGAATELPRLVPEPAPGSWVTPCAAGAARRIGWIVGASAPASLGVRDLEGGGVVVRTFSDPSEPEVWKCEMTRDGDWMLGAGRHELLVFDARTLELASVTPLESATEIVTTAIAPSRSLIAVGFEDGRVDVHRFTPQGSALRTRLEGRGEPITALAWSDDERRLAAGFAAGTVRVWDAATGELVDSFAVQTSGITSLAMAGSRVLVSRSDGTLQSWKPDAGERSRLQGHASYAYAVATASPRVAVSGGWDGRSGQAGALKWWDLSARKLIASWGDSTTRVLDVAVTADGAHLVVCGSDAAEAWVKVIDARDASVEQHFPLTGAPPAVEASGACHDIALLDGERAVTVDAWGTAWLLDLSAGSAREIEGRELLTSWSEEDRAVAASPDRGWLAMSWRAGGIQLLAASTLETVARWRAHDAPLWSLAFSPDGKLLASTSDDGTIALWEVPSGRLVHVLRGAGSPVLCAAWSPDQGRLATGSRTGSVNLWDPGRALLVARLTGHSSYVRSLAWTPDGRELLSASGDHELRVWSLQSRPEHEASVAEHDALWTRLEPDVLSELQARGEARAVARWIDRHPAMTSREREVAHEILLRRSLAPAPAGPDSADRESTSPE